MASKVKKYLNPPFDPRMLSIGPPSLNSKNLQRGRLVSADANQTTGVKHGVHFLYNPVSVSASHTISADYANGATYGQSSSASTTMGQQVNIGGVSVDLLYDRTYDLWDHSKRNTLAGKYGVYADVLAFYMLLGITDTGKVTLSDAVSFLVPDANAKKSTVTWQSAFPAHPISGNNRMYLYIGDKMRFYGTITDFSITYSHWNEKMIPARCQVSIGMSFQTDPGAQSATITRARAKGGDNTGTGGGHKKKKNISATIPGGHNDFHRRYGR